MADGARDAQNSWVTLVLGVDPRTLAAPAHRRDAAPDPNAEIIAHIDATIASLEAAGAHLSGEGLTATQLPAQIADFHARLDAATKSKYAKRLLADLKKDTDDALNFINEDTGRQENAAGAGGDKAIIDLRDAATTLIGKLPEGDPKTDLSKILGDLNNIIDSAAKLTDAKQQAAARQANDQTVQALIKAAIAAGGKKPGVVNKDVQDAFKKALIEKYGITIDQNTDHKTNLTHFDQIYEMFEKVPQDQAINAKMKDFSYVSRLNVGKKGNSHGIGYFNGAGIEVGDFGDETWPYTNPNTGKPEQPNGFSITVLHELGHSVDKRWGIMDKYQTDKTCGGWDQHNVDTLAGQIATAIARKLAQPTLTAEIITPAAHTALSTGGNTKAPDGVDEAAWADVQKALANWIEMRNSGAPYKIPHNFNGRTYVPNGKAWFSYLPAARAAMQVTDYQWSAPAEWFAELYAISWFKKQPAPAAVNEHVRAYMPQ